MGADNSTSSARNNLLQIFFRHHLWSNLRLFDACMTLTDDQLNHSDKGTYGSIRATLTHLLRAEERYLFFLSGQELPTPESDAQTPLSAMRERVQHSGKLLLQVIDTVDAEELVQVGEGEETEQIPMKVFLLQAIHHAHEHRTQVTTLMGQLGIKPPHLSGWSYFDDIIAPQQNGNNGD